MEIRTVGLLGAGTMGSGVAQVAALHVDQVIMCDVKPEVLQSGLARVREFLERGVKGGKIAPEAAEVALTRIRTTLEITDLAPADLVIESVPEDLELKREVFARLDEVCPPPAILTTNTSSLSVTAIAAATQHPERVAGLHFFNPAPIMQLVEVVKAQRTAPEVLNTLGALMERWGKVPVQVRDTPGFIAIRVGRPFYCEALRLLEQRAASVQTIDRITREAGGFPMGPFELMDLVGLDVNLAEGWALFEAMFWEHRFRPSRIQDQMVLAGRLGRKTGRGFYDYDDPSPSGQGSATGAQPAGKGDAGSRAEDLKVVIVGERPLVEELAYLCRAADYEAIIYVRESAAMEAPFGIAGFSDVLDSTRQADVVIEVLNGSRDHKQLLLQDLDLGLRPGALLLSCCYGVSATRAGGWIRRPERVVGFAAVPPLADRQVVEVAPGLRTSRDALDRARAFFRAMGREPVVVDDGPGLVLPRMVACIINEAVYALSEGVASAQDIDAAMRLGTGYPLGPLEWADRMGIDQVLAVLEGLAEEFGAEHYRPAPLLRKMVAAGWLGRKTGRGFYQYR